MITGMKSYLARQARKPSGWFGRTVAPRVFNKENREVEQFGLELMKPKPGDCILEIGFGNGRLLSHILPHLGDGKASGIDLSPEMVALAAKRNRQWMHKGMLDLVTGSVEQIPYGDNSFDQVFTANTIYFWPEPEHNLRKVKRVLEEGGRFLCAMRLRHQMTGRASAFQRSVVNENLDVFEHLYDEEEVQELFSRAGFRDVRIHTRTGSGEHLYIVEGWR